MTEETVTMKSLVGVRVYAIYVAVIYVLGSIGTIAILHQKLGFRDGDVARLEERVRLDEESEKRAEAQCDARVERSEGEFRWYKRQQRIESDRAECLELAHTSRDVSVEGCMDRRAKEWPIP